MDNSKPTKHTLPLKGLGARPWNIQTIHDATKKCRSDRQTTRNLYMQARQMMTALCECFEEELNKIPKPLLNPDDRKSLLRDVNDYNQRLFKWLGDGQDEEKLNPIKHESLTLEYTSLVRRLRDLQQSAGTKRDEQGETQPETKPVKELPEEISWLHFCDTETFQKIANEMGKTPQELNKAIADFSEDERMSIEIRLREERIRKEEEDTGYTNKETGKPYKRKELNLPPLGAEVAKLLMKMTKGIPCLGMRRLICLPYYGAFVLNHIKEKSPSVEERLRLSFAFTVECQEAMHAVTKFVDRCQNNDPQSRNDLIGKYRIWEDKLLQAFEQQWLQLAGKPARLSTQSFAELAREQAQLLFRQVGQMAKIEAEHNSSGEFVSRLISVKTDPAKKPAGVKQDLRPVEDAGKKTNNKMLRPTVDKIAEIIKKLRTLKEKQTAFVNAKGKALDSDKLADGLATCHIRNPLKYTGSIEELIKASAGLDATLTEPPLMEDILAGGMPTKTLAEVIRTLPIDELQRLLNTFLPDIESTEIPTDNKFRLQEIRTDLSRELEQKMKLKDATVKIRETINGYEKLRTKPKEYWPQEIQDLIDEIDTLLFPYLDCLEEKGTWEKSESSKIEMAIKSGRPVDLDDVIQELEKIKYKMGIEAERQPPEKPGEDLVSLPSIVPELDIVPDDLVPEIKRVFNLCWLGYSTAVEARDNRYSRHQRAKLITDFVIECDAALFSVSKLSKSFEGTIGDQERIDLFRDFEQFCQRLKKLVEDSISNNSAGFRKFYYLYFHSLSPLLQRMLLMSDIDAYTMNKALREGLEKWTKEHQDKHVEEPPKKTAPITEEHSEPVTLREFMKQECGVDSQNLLNSKTKFLQKNNPDKIQLPKHHEPWTSGQPKRYCRKELREAWPKYHQLFPHNVPPLKTAK